MLLEYERLAVEAAALHGDRVALFMQVGSFLEMYWAPGSAGAAAADAARERLGLAIMNRKEPVSRAKPYCTGFPHHLAAAKVAPLLDDGWIVCIADQVDAPGRTRQRELSRCMSPSMRQDARPEPRSGRSGNYAACVLSRKGVVGAAFIDVATGCSLVTDGDGLHAATESRNVTELILIGDAVPSGAAVQGAAVHDRTGERWAADVRAALSDANVRDVLAQAYGRGPALTEDMLLLGSRPAARDALAYVLVFTRRHSLQLGVGLPPPEIFESGVHVRVSPHALQQLGVLQLDADRRSRGPGRARAGRRPGAPQRPRAAGQPGDGVGRGGGGAGARVRRRGRTRASDGVVRVSSVRRRAGGVPARAGRSMPPGPPCTPTPGWRRPPTARTA